MQRPTIEKPDLREKGGVKDGEPQAMDRRLFMQFHAFGNCADSKPLIDALAASNCQGALYHDASDPQGIGLMTMSEDPSFFVEPLRELLTSKPFDTLVHKPQFTMFGRTYSLGYEPDLEEALFGRPRNTVLNPDWPWVVMYPLRRRGAFSALDHKEQREILMEHGTIGRSYGESDLAHDIRLACHGLDAADNDFVIGLIGKELHPLSAIVQRMRTTQQTSLYIEKLGPFWIGKAVWQSPRP